MVAHIVGRCVSYDKVGIGVADYLYRLVSLLHIIAVRKQVADVAVDNFDSGKRTRLFGFRRTDKSEFVGHDDFMSHITVAEMANGYIVASLNASDKRSDAVYLHVVRVTAYCKNIHTFAFHSRFNGFTVCPKRSSRTKQVYYFLLLRL